MVVAAECRFAVKNRETGGDAVRDMEDDFFEEDDDSESELVGVLCTPFPTSSQRRLQSSPRESDIRKAAPTVRDSKNSSLPSSRACKVAKVHPSETRLEPEDVRNTKGSGSKSSGRGKGSQRLPVIKEVPSRENSESKPLHRDCPELQSEHKGWRLGTTVLPVESSQSDECDEDEDDIFSENFMGSKSGGNKPSMAEEKDVILGDAQVVPDDVVVGEEIPPDEVEGKSAADAKVASGDAENVDEEIPCGSAASSKSEPTSEPPTVPRKDRRAPEKEDRIDDPAIAISVYDLIPETQTPSEGSQAEAAEASPLSGFHPEETPKQFESAAEGSEQHNDQDHLRAADVSPAENIGAESKVAHELDETAEHTRQEELKSEFYRSEFYGTATESPSPPPEMRMKPSNSGASPARQADAGRSDTRPGSELPCAAESRQRETSLSPDQESEQGSIDDFVAPPEASKGFITARGRGVTISDNGRKKAEEVLGDLSALAQAAPSQSTTRLTERTPLSEVQISAAAAVASTSLCPSHSGSRVLSSSARTTSENVTVNALDADVQTILPSSDRSTEDQMFVGSSTDRGKAGGKLEFKRERAFSSDAFGRDSKVASERDEPVGLDQQRLQRDAFQSEFYDGPEAESLNKCVPRGGFTAGFSVGQGKVMQELGLEEARCAAPMPSENVEAPSEGFATGSGCGKATELSDESVKGATQLANSDKEQGSVLVMVQPPADTTKGARATTGVKTGRGNGFHVSEDSQTKVEQLLGDDAQPDSGLQFSPVGEREARFAAPAHSENVEALAGGLGGFATGRGKVLKVSEDGLKRASALFGDLNGEGVGSGPAMAQAPIDSAKGASGSRESIRKGSGDGFFVPESALRRTGQLLDQEDQPDPSVQFSQSSKQPFEEKEEASMALPVHSENVGAPAGGLGGFATGRGKALKVSEDGLKRASAPFGDLNGEGVGSGPAMAQAPIDSAKGASGSRESIRKGSGDGFFVPESALKTGQLLDQEDQPDPSVQLSQSSKRPFEEEEEASMALPVHSENVGAPAGGLGGFATGRGKALKVSEDGLKRASALFGDLNGEGVGSGPAMAQAPIDSAKGASGSRESFSTGRGNSVKNSESALRRTGQLLGDQDQPDPSAQLSQSSKRPFEEEEEASMVLQMHSENVGAPAGGLGGFATGRGKTLELSEDGLKRASALFGDLNGNEASPMRSENVEAPAGGLGGFATGRGKTLELSEDGLKRASALFGDLNGNEAPPMRSENVEAPAGGLGGFATGRGKTLELSEDGLKRASALFGDLNGNEEGGSEVSVAQPPIKKPKAASSGSFSTGRGGGVHISESALRKTGQLFGDQDQPDSKAQGSERSKGKEPAIFNTPFNHERPSHNTLSERATVHRAQPQSFSILKTSSSTASGVGLVTPAPKRSAETASFSSTAAPKSRRPFKAPRLLNQTPVTPAGNAAGQAAGHSRSQQTPAPFCVTPLRDSGEGGKTMPSIQRRISSASNVTPQLLFSSPESDSQIRAMSKTLNFKGFTSSEDFIRRMQHAVPLSLCQAVHGQTPFSDESNGNIEIAEYMKIVSVTSSNAAAFRLSASGSHFFDSEHADPAGRVGAEDMLRVLASNHQKSTDLTAEWVANHYRWIVWKLAAMERAFPSIFGGNYLTPDRVYLQLLNRFDREVVRGERSIVKEILDRDQVANHPMVLCVSHAVQKSDDSVHLMLTDGWHEIGANIDPELTRLATCGKLFVGQKLRIFGADRDMDESKPVTLKLTINGVSRAKWDEKLGRTKEAPCLGLRCIRPGGGLVPAVRVVVQRIFPKVYMESCGDGTKLWRSEAVEVKTQQEYEDRVNREWEKFLGKKMDSNQLGHSSEADGGQEGDMAEQAHEREKQMNSWRESFMEQDAMTLRKVCAVLKMRVSCLHPAQAGHAGGDALLTWWRPGEAMASIQEGSAFVIRNVQANDMRKGGLPCLSFMKETRCTPVEDPRVASVYRPRRVVGVEDIGSCNLEDDLDVCGAVVEVSEVVMDIGRSGLPCHKQHVILTGPSLLSLQDEDVETCMDAQFRTCYLRVELGVDSIMPLRLSASQLPCVLTIRNLSRPRQLRETGSVKVYSCQANAEAEISQSPPAKPRHAAAQQKQTLDSHAWEAIRAWTDRSRDEIMSGEVSLANLTW